MLSFLFLSFLHLDCDMQSIDLSIIHAALCQFCILLGFEIDDGVVFDLGVLPDADGVDISEVGENFFDVAFGEIGRKVFDCDSGELDAVLRRRGGRGG